jgi:hypothetical protein
MAEMSQLFRWFANQNSDPQHNGDSAGLFVGSHCSLSKPTLPASTVPRLTAVRPVSWNRDRHPASSASQHHFTVTRADVASDMHQAL